MESLPIARRETGSNDVRRWGASLSGSKDTETSG